jgi:anionic cell wall polymer biosynthesis LytR-Cps2A-Psr (LCP) family protein
MNSYMEDMYYELGTEYEELTEPGMQHLSGIQATAYCRIRYTAGDDFKRAERQRTVLSLTMDKAKRANPIQLISAVNKVLGRMSTSLDTWELMKFILAARAMDITESSGFPTEEDRTFATVNGESCVIPYYLTTNVKNLHNTLFGQADYEPSETVEENNDIINSYVQ